MKTITEGTSQGLFVVVAIVIFGIFVGLTYTVFGSEGLSNDLNGIFSNAMEQTTNDIAELNRDYRGILKDSESRKIYSNDSTRYPLDFKTMTDSEDSFQRATLSKSSPIDTFSIYSPILEGQLRETLWKGKAVEFSVTFRSNAIGQIMKYSYVLKDMGYDTSNRQKLADIKVNGEWQTIKIIIPNHQYDPTSENGLIGHLMLHMKSIKDNHVDIKEFNIRIADE